MSGCIPTTSKGAASAKLQLLASQDEPKILRVEVQNTAQDPAKLTEPKRFEGRPLSDFDTVDPLGD
jgi:hypothetical protein